MSVSSSLTSLLQFNVNASALTITGLQYNPSPVPSEWVERIFGGRAIFYQKNLGPPRTALSRKELMLEEIEWRTQNVRKKWFLPEYAVWPLCSIELLGYARLEKSSPFTYKDRNGKAIPIGNATLQIDSSGMDWNCFYRPLWENWRAESEATNPNFWAVMFYCPAPNQEVSCDSYEKFIAKR